MIALQIADYQDYLNITGLRVCEICKKEISKNESNKYMGYKNLCEECYVSEMTAMGEDRVWEI